MDRTTVFGTVDVGSIPTGSTKCGIVDPKEIFMSDNATPVDALIAQGCCCGSGCENCPYDPVHQAGTDILNQGWIGYKTTHPAATRDQYEKDKAAGTLVP